jgi:hypothetical protein
MTASRGSPHPNTVPTGRGSDGLLTAGEAACRLNGRIAVSRLAELKAVTPAGHEIVMILRAKDGVRVFTSSKLGDPSWEHEALIPHRRHICPRTNKSDPTCRASCLAA